MTLWSHPTLTVDRGIRKRKLKINSGGEPIESIADINARFLEISRNPLIYQLRPKIGPAVRLAAVGSYAILFRVVENTVQVERMVYDDGDLPGILNPH
jgi:hypothetical protein